MDYKETLLMPKTKFPMRGNLPNKEPIRRQEWEDNRLYEKDRARTEGRPLFILHDGPPYANGDLHTGHALNKILKDFITRYKSMSGYHAPYVPGWDTHGLQILRTRKPVFRHGMIVRTLKHPRIFQPAKINFKI